MSKILMRFFPISFFVIILLFSACGPRYGDFFPCHDDGSVKPKVVLLPMKDATGHCDIAEGLMQNIRYRLMDCGNLYVYPEELIYRQLKKMENVSFFDSDISFALQFGGADFIVATELVECRSELYGKVEAKCLPPHLQRKNLMMMKLRVRVIDLRCQEPILVLQEIIPRNLLVPNQKTEMEKVDNSYIRELTHRLSEDFVNRLEEVIP